LKLILKDFIDFLCHAELVSASIAGSDLRAFKLNKAVDPEINSG
jgi:hypothetical protein